MAGAQSNILPVAVDAMGGDRGCMVAVEGAVRAARELGIASCLVGDVSQLRVSLSSLGASSEPLVTLREAPTVVTMDDAPSVVIRGKPDSSIRRAFEVVKAGEATGVVSAGNTGAMMAAGVFVSGTIPGIARPAIASLIPRVGAMPPTVLLDSGANVDCHAAQLVQFALMGSCYAVSALPCTSPRVGLLSNGSELKKGNDVTRAAAHMLSELEDINFIGYVEGRDIPRDAVDVVVCDGFVGNVVLKCMEGSVELVFDSIKHYVNRDLFGRLGMWLAKPMLKSLFRDKLDPSTYGGAPLLGLNDVAIVCHGASGPRDFFNAIRVARRFADDKIVQRMQDALGSLDVKLPDGIEEGFWDRVGQRFEKYRGKNHTKKNLGRTRGYDAVKEKGSRDDRKS